MTYRRRIDRDHPTCLIFLVDQSDSMLEPLAGDPSRTKRAAVAQMLNDIIYELILRCVKSPQEGPRPYFALAAIGYGTDADGEPVVRSALPSTPDARDIWWTTDLANSPLRIDRRAAPSGVGEIAAPVWIEPASSGGTPMCLALDRAGRIARSWTEAHHDSFPPIVLNLTDGEATDGDPTVWASRLQSLGTDDGSLLLFNLNLSSTPADVLLFPASPDRLPNAQARTLFAMSSTLPDFMVDAARAQGLQTEAGARGFGFNADLRSVVTFMNVGTSVGRLVR
ncbi:MAG: hypothetical protein JWM47_2110 [Acidimicrobiales bacterium]|nr:hypothetical protein [Acidimicrobiales bacterium]